MDFLRLPNNLDPKSVRSIRFGTPPPMQVLRRAEASRYGSVRLCIYPLHEVSSSHANCALSHETKSEGFLEEWMERAQIVINYHVRHSWESTGSAIGSIPAKGIIEENQNRVSLDSNRSKAVVLPDCLTENLERIRGPGSDSEVALVAVVLRDGTRLPRVYLSPSPSAEIDAYFVTPSNILRIEKSEFACPDWIRRKIRNKETGMNSLEFRLRMDDGALFPCWFPCAENGFLEVPFPYTLERIVDIEVRNDLAVHERAILVPPDHVWCKYQVRPRGAAH